ncbi:MAG: GHKL domain-containing protein [Lachnospiraceae bacterium]|jgi:two-component system sensor histidine kinase AgrC|nr:GHKL domain-containing protein [Lachnospiraceae bacterium]
MLMNNVLAYGTDILLIGFAIYLFCSYFDIFFRRRNKMWINTGLFIFAVWQLIIVKSSGLPVYMNISITTIATFFAVFIVYEEGFWKKCIFSITFNAIWMLLEVLCGYILLFYCKQFVVLQELKPLGSFISKLLFLLIILSLRRVFMDDEIKELSVQYSMMLAFIPIGSIYIMNNIFMFYYKVNSRLVNVHLTVIAVILLSINVLIFYLYMKLAADLQLGHITSIYEHQLELCEHHQEERELSILQMRDMKHNMKNNLVSILALAEKKECDKIVNFVNEIMEEGGMKISSITNSGNVVIDSLIGYWYVVAKKVGIDFSVNIHIPMKMPFKGADLCLILGNLLENAVEAARKGEEEKYIKVHMKYDKNNLLLFVMNNYKTQLIKTKDKRLKSTKTDSGNHGVGLPSVYRAAAKYHGTVIIEDSIPGRFLIRVILYGKYL